MESKFEQKEIGSEILKEWYQEKGIFEESFQEKESVKTPNVFISLKSKKPSEDKIQEESKKKIVKDQIKVLLGIAEKKGLEESIKQAKKKNDPFLLDIYHDVLAKDGYYKRILRK